MPLASRFLETVFHLSLGPGFVAFILYTASKLAIAFSVAFLLVMVTEKRKLRYFAFTFGIIGVPLYQTISYNIAAVNYYGVSPTILLQKPFLESIATDLTITPLVVWLGTYLGNEYQVRKTA